ncbi:glycosyltransferase [Verrucomicrobiota bacterium]
MQSKIIAFTKDWDDVPTCTTHILREMAKDMHVLWIESIGTRKPNLARSRDLMRGWRKVISALRPAEIKENNLRVLSPLVIPKPESRFGKWLNRKLLGAAISRELKEMGSGPVEYWCFIPNAVDFLPEIRRLTTSEQSGDPDCSGQQLNNPETSTGIKLSTTDDESVVVYYCADDWSKFHYLDEAWIAKKENELIQRADIVFVVSRCLEDKHRESAGGKMHYMPHGVEYEKFAAALEEDTIVLPDIANVSKPVIGFYGNIYPWIDFVLLEELAQKRPLWNFVMIGQVYCDISRFNSMRNVHFPGRREHDDLPKYCKAFDAAIIPYDMKNSRMESVSPVKTKELLAAGVPIVASRIPELELEYSREKAQKETNKGKDIITCATASEWIEAIEKQIARTDRRAISQRVKKEDWVEKIGIIREMVDKTYAV